MGGFPTAVTRTRVTSRCISLIQIFEQVSAVLCFKTRIIEVTGSNLGHISAYVSVSAILIRFGGVAMSVGEYLVSTFK